MRTLRLIKRLFLEMPQPARGLVPAFFAFSLLSLPLTVLKASEWLLLLDFVAAALSIFFFGLCIFRDINGAATAWSRMYKESKGIPPEGFTMADVPTIKFMGFMYMVMGALGVVLLVFEGLRWASGR
jgi:hypothetical protein